MNPGEKRDVRIPIYNDGTEIIWSGSMSGRTNCTNTTCETADCNNGVGGCLPSHGFFQPATQAEITMQKSMIDFYDVEVINGVHLPISMGPINTESIGGPYDCGHPGAKYPVNSKLGSCSWDLQPPSNDYNQVTAGGDHCDLDSECTESGEVCGLSFNPGHVDLLQKTCGRRIGYYSADQICGIIPTFGAPFNCPANFNQLLCVGVGSCYQQSAAADCCGCSDWDKDDNLIVPPFPDTEQCKNKNPQWISNVKPTLKWLKTACPTAYTYPFDDMSSTFTCKNMQNGVN